MEYIKNDYGIYKKLFTHSPKLILGLFLDINKNNFKFYIRKFNILTHLN